MHKETIEKITTAIMYVNTLSLAEHFGDCETPEEFAEVFNEEYYRYQKVNKLKLDPFLFDENPEGRTTCTAAALYMGLWYLLTTGIEPVYFIENIRFDECRSKSSSHVVVALPPEDFSKKDQIEAVNTLSSDLLYYEYMLEDTNNKRSNMSLREVDPSNLHDFSIRANTGTMTANRVSLFGLKDDTIRALLELLEEKNLEQYVNNYPEFMFFLNALYWGDLDEDGEEIEKDYYE